MKKLIYKIKGYTTMYNTKTEKLEQHLSFAEVIIENPTDEDIAKAAETAYNGEYTIEDDGQPEPETQPTQEERLTELEEAFDLLLSGVTE